MNLFPNYSRELSQNINSIILDYSVGNKEYQKQVYNSVTEEILERIHLDHYLFQLKANEILGIRYGNICNRIRYKNEEYVALPPIQYSKQFKKFMGRNDI